MSESDLFLGSGARTALLAVLRERYAKGETGPWHATALYLWTADRLVDVGLVQPRQENGHRVHYHARLAEYAAGYGLKSELWPDLWVPGDAASAIREALWELLVRGVLRPSAGPNVQPYGVRHFVHGDHLCLTAQGQRMVQQSADGVWAHDRTGYLEALRSAGERPDEEILRYVEEALAVYGHGHFLATIVLLGTASERVVEALAERLRDALSLGGGGEQWYLSKYEAKWQITERFDAVLSKLTGEFGQELKSARLLEGLRRLVRLYFEELRDARNSVAHARGQAFTWAEVSGLVHGFVPYYRHLRAVMDVLPQPAS